MGGKNTSAYLAIGLSALIASSAARAETFILGDSLSDVGALGITYTNPILKNGAQVSGPVWPNDLKTVFDPQSPYDKSPFCNEKSCVLNPKTYYYTGGGDNYAVGGAGITFDSPDAREHVSFTSLPAQVQSLINRPLANSRNTIIIWIGANDVIQAAKYNSSATQDALVDTAAATLRDAVNKLHTKCPLCSINVIQLPDLGKTPLGQAMGPDVLSTLSTRFNSGLNMLVMPNVKVLPVSFQVQSRASYCSKLIDPLHPCGSNSNPLDVALSTSPSLQFADPLHASTSTHALIAKSLLTQLGR